MKLRCLAPILLASLTLSISPRSTWAQVKHSSISGTPVQVEVTLKSAADNAANLSRVAGRVGRVFVKDSKHHAYRLAVKSGMPADRPSSLRRLLASRRRAWGLFLRRFEPG